VTKRESRTAGQSETRDYVAKMYYQDQQIAESYDYARSRDLSTVRWALDRRALRRCFEDVPASSPVLDIACGTGRVTLELIKQGFKVVGTDISAAMLLVARQQLRPVPPLVLADAERLPFREGTFRAATARSLIGNLPPEVRTRVLRAAGLVADLVIVDHTIRTRLGDLRRRVLRRRRSPRPSNYPWAVVSEAELAAQLDEAGLVERRRVYRLPGLSDAVWLVLERH